MAVLLYRKMSAPLIASLFILLVAKKHVKKEGYFPYSSACLPEMDKLFDRSGKCIANSTGIDVPSNYVNSLRRFLCSVFLYSSRIRYIVGQERQVKHISICDNMNAKYT